MFSLQTLLKGTFSLLTCHLQFSITTRVSMTLKRQSVQSLSGYKAARTFCVSQEGGIVEVMVWSKTKWSFPLVLGRGGTVGEGRGEWDWGQNRKISLKNTTENDKEKIKERKQERKKDSQSKAVEKLVLPNQFLPINNEASAKSARRSSWILYLFE